MKSLLVITLAIALIAICAFPVSAQDNSQYANGVVIGSKDVQQSIVNNNDQLYQNQKSSGVVVGNGNKQDIDNSISTTDVTNNGGSSTSYTVNNEAPAYTYHDTLVGDTNSETISLYQNDALVVPMNSGLEMERGQAANITWLSADPILVYAIDTNDADAIRENSANPVFEDFSGIYDFGPVHVYRAVDYRHASRARQYLSTNNAMEFVAPENGYYSFVLDTRPAFKRNGQEIHGLLDSTCDITFAINNDGFANIPQVNGFPKIGKVDVFPVDKKGHIITT